jgi:hypothetical protein
MERPQYDFPAVKTFLALAVMTLSAGSMLAQASSGAVAESLKSNVVRIEANLGDHTELGFGFIIGERSGNLYIVTANHVVYPQEAGQVAPTKVKVEFFDHQGEPFEATVLGTHDVPHDLAVLSVAPPQGFQWNKRCLGQSEEPKRSTEVSFIGKGQKWYVPSMPGHVASEEIIDGRIALEGLPIVPGCSGGPLVDSSGIVGIILSDSVESATALELKYVKFLFKQWNHPWDLDRGDAVAPVSPPATAANPPAAQPVVPASNPLREGFYELYTLNGQPQRKSVLMHLRRVSDDYFLAETTTASDNGWSGELRRSGSGWDLKIADLRGSHPAREGSSYNPGSGRNEISAEGPLVTFKSELGTYVWQETQKTSIEPPTAPASSAGAQSASSSNGQAVLGALVGAFMATRTHSNPPDQCVSGYVWREARPDDHVCVTPETRRRTAIENSRAAAYRNPNGGAYGPDTCLDGYLWRNAFAGDRVCVSPESRSQAAEDNSQARGRVAH